MLYKYLFFLIASVWVQASNLYANPEATPGNWPCVQRYVPELSAAVIWPGQLDENTAEELSNNSAIDNSIETIANQLANRREDLDEATSNTEKYISEQSGDHDLLANMLFAKVFEKIQLERKRIIQGIFRYTDRQRKLGKRIEEQRRKLKSISKEKNVDEASESNLTQREDLEARQKWDIRAFRERERKLNYLCEQPVLLEQRLFAVARYLQQYLPE